MSLKTIIAILAVVCTPALAHAHTQRYAPKPYMAEPQHPFPGNGTVCGGVVYRVNNDLCDFQASGAGRY